MSSRGGQNEANMAPWRPPGGVPGGLWAALGRGGRFLSDFEFFLTQRSLPFGTPQNFKTCVKIAPEIQQRF